MNMAKYKTVAISPEIHRKARLKALRLGVSLGRTVDELLEDWLERPEETREETRRDGDTTVGDPGSANPD
jgi:hypothetical protein